MRGQGVATCALLGCLVVPTTASAADELELAFEAGRVTVVASDIPLRTILDEWARIGDTTFVDAHQVSSQPVSVEMIDVPESEALRVLLRSVGGYVVAPRAIRQDGASAYDRVLIMATARRRARRPASYSPASPSRPPDPLQLGEPSAADETAPDMIIEPDDAAEIEQLELLEQLRGRYQSEAPAPDLFSQPSFLPTDRSADDGGAGMQATPFPGMVTGSSNDSPRPRRARPVAPQRGDP